MTPLRPSSWAKIFIDPYWTFIGPYWTFWSSWSYELNLILIEFLQAIEKNSINVCFLSKCYLPFAIGSESLFITEIGTSLVCRLYLMLSSKHSWLKSKEALITDLRKDLILCDSSVMTTTQLLNSMLWLRTWSALTDRHEKFLFVFLYKSIHLPGWSKFQLSVNQFLEN